MGKSVSRLKRSVLELLEKDLEFRYAVAGYLGLSELMKRMDSLEENMVKLLENQNKLWEEVKSLREGQNKLWEEIRDLREGQEKLWENQSRIWEEVRSLRENQEKLWENQSKLWEEVKALREGQNKLWEGQNKLWEGQNRLWEGQSKLWEEVRNIRITLNRVAVTLDRLTISVEEEALSYIRYRLREKLGIEVDLDRLFIDAREINIYGVVGDLCVIGEAAVRLGVGLVDELKEKIDIIREKRPELLKPKIIKVIYTDYATPDALEYARREKVWVLKWSGDLTPMVIEEI
ncbi:MAG: hypothetical protein QXE61_04545 [Nitrososphaerota archaeon]